jgi:hypothetical protein
MMTRIILVQPAFAAMRLKHDSFSIEMHIDHACESPGARARTDHMAVLSSSQTHASLKFAERIIPILAYHLVMKTVFFRSEYS